LVTGVAGELGATLNGATLEWMEKLKSPELFVEFNGPADAPDRRPSQAASRTYRGDAAKLRSGENVLELANPSGAEVEVRTVNLGLW
jgi:hypothetical protein